MRRKAFSVHIHSDYTQKQHSSLTFGNFVSPLTCTRCAELRVTVYCFWSYRAIGPGTGRAHRSKMLIHRLFPLASGPHINKDSQFLEVLRASFKFSHVLFSLRLQTLVYRNGASCPCPSRGVASLHQKAVRLSTCLRRTTSQDRSPGPVSSTTYTGRGVTLARR